MKVLRIAKLICLNMAVFLWACGIAYSACSNCSLTKHECTKIIAKASATTPETQYGCPGAQITMTINAPSNWDYCGDPYPVEDTGLKETWSGCVSEGPTENLLSKTYRIPSTATPGQSFTATCSVDDDGLCYDDDPATVTFTIIALGITGISGPTVVLKDSTATFSVSGTFGTSASSVTWSGGSSTGAGSSYTTSFGTSGWTWVYATLCDVPWTMLVYVIGDDSDATPSLPPLPTLPGTCPVEQQ